ncbi:MAG: hypothetical protein KKF10_02700, partial [Verrucomicrobia bacterium]|nr:hypothetical protein [Verrucomicrobiota bacterium]
MRKHLILNVLKTMMFMLCMTSAVTGHTAGAPSVLVVTFDVEPVVRPWEQAWIDAGYQVKAVQYYRQVDWELLRRFNLLVVMPPLNYNVTGQDRAPYVAQPEEVAALSALVGRFLEQGGGVFFYGNCANTTLPPCVETLLKPYGANVLFEKVTDPNQTYQQPGRARQSFSFTANVVPFPSTEGVRTIYYPTGFFMYGPMTSPLKLSADWQVLVKGSATARSLAATYKTVHWPAWETNNLGTYTSKPPLIACRQVGKGRLAVSGLSPYMSMIWTGHPFYEDICLSRGDGHTPSDLGKLQSQLFRWLTTPSVGSTVLGGYVNEKRPLEYNEAQQRPIAWTPEYGRGGPDPYLPGIIGARTALTGGSGTVADWAQAARQAGLSWLVFAEDFARLTPQTWEKFKQECAAACADDLVMAPGWEILDVRGNHWLQAGLAMGWFAPSILSADGKRIEDAQNGRFGIAQTFTAAIQ